MQEKAAERQTQLEAAEAISKILQGSEFKDSKMRSAYYAAYDVAIDVLSIRDYEKKVAKRTEVSLPYFMNDVKKLEMDALRAKVGKTMLQYRTADFWHSEKRIQYFSNCLTAFGRLIDAGGNAETIRMLAG